MKKKFKVIYSSLPDNKFFQTSSIEMGNLPDENENGIVNIFDDIKYQEILGFGGAFTESAAYNYALMSDKNKKLFLKSYFDDKNGIGYNFGRTHINSCDFSLGKYTYVEEGDKTLDSFNIERDKKYIIPFLKDAMKYADGITLFASPWSPPDYMKDSYDVFRGGKLLDEYKDTWAHYYAKYIKSFREEGINISAISIQNEPMATQTWESCTYTAKEEADFAENYLIPALDSEDLSDIKIIIWDHNKERVFDRARDVLKAEVLKKRIWAVGFHWYSGNHFEGLKLVHDVLNKPTICTEFCCGIKNSPDKIAESYAIEICEDLNNYCIGICDWNLLLSTNGGPFHNRIESGSELKHSLDPQEGGCAAPVLYDEENDKVIFTPSYYYMGHFSKYIKRGAKRLAVTKYHKSIYASAFENPDGSRVAVIVNTNDILEKVAIRYMGKCTLLNLGPHSIATVLI